MKIPDRDIDQLETESYWMVDRASLKHCRASFTTLQTYYNKLRTSLNPPEH